MRELLEGRTKLIRERLKVEWLYASPMAEEGVKTNKYRIVEARSRKGIALEVKTEGGLWFVPNEIWREVRSA